MPLIWDEIVAPNHYHFLGDKTKGARLMHYYSIKHNYPWLIYFTMTTYIVIKELHKEKKGR
jgi:hypothetical protein